MSGSMPDYRLYLVDGNRIIGPPTIITCASDKAAITAARERHTLHDIEVWEGARCVTRLKAPDAT